MRVRLTVLCFITFVLFINTAPAQSPNGTVSGIVLDPSGGVIVGADVLIINNATGVQYPGKANSEGYYVVPNIPPGTYRIQVSNSGFKTIIKPDIVIHVAGRARDQLYVADWGCLRDSDCPRWRADHQHGKCFSRYGD